VLTKINHMKVAVVIPCFNVRGHIIRVLEKIPAIVDQIYIVDDACPEKTGQFIENSFDCSNITVLYNKNNQGVGGAVITGYKQAIIDDYDVVVKLDGDGQMDPHFISSLIRPILEGKADYVKGNRFFSLESLKTMPTVRKFGNAILSLVNKVSSGYWNIMDPTNGYTAIHKKTLRLLPLEKLDQRYFFESDLLFRLGTIRAVVRDAPMSAHYADEESGLNIGQTARRFPWLYLKAFFKRVFYTYYLRDFNRASIELLLASPLLLFGFSWGITQWIHSIETMEVASTGTVMLAVLPITIGFQMLLDAINFDISNTPVVPLQEYFLD